MKRFLVFFLAVLNCCWTWAQSPYAGTAVTEIVSGNDYYLYNVGTGKWLGDNNRVTSRYTSRAELVERGLDIEVKKISGGYQLNPKLGGNHSINASNLYMDTNLAVTTWVFTAVEGVSKGFTITSGSNTLGSDANGDIVNNATLNTTWQLVTREERMAVDTQNATAEGVDLSWAIYGGTFPIADERRAQWWQGSYGSNNIGGDDYYHCQRVWEMWAINERDVYQTLTGLPNGVYGVSAQAIYVSSGNGSTSAAHYNAYLDGSEPTNGYVYAGNARVPMVNMYSMVTDQSVPNFNTRNLGNGKYAPEATLQYANHIFRGDGLTDEVKVYVHNGQITFGVQVEDGKGGSWIIFDNFNLKYYGQSVLYQNASNLLKLVELAKQEIESFPDKEYQKAINLASEAFSLSNTDAIDQKLEDLRAARKVWAQKKMAGAIYTLNGEEAIWGGRIENLSAGRYRVVCQGFTRNGDFDYYVNNASTAQSYWASMMVNGYRNSVALADIADESFHNPGFGRLEDGVLEIPVTDEDAQEYFDNALYLREVTVDVEEGGSLDIVIDLEKYNANTFHDDLKISNIRVYAEGVPFMPSAKASYTEYTNAPAEVAIQFGKTEDAAFEYGAENNIKVMNANGAVAATVKEATNYYAGKWDKNVCRLSLSEKLKSGIYSVVIPKGSMIFKETAFAAFDEDITVELTVETPEQGVKPENPNPYLTGNEPVQTYADGTRIAWQYNKQRYIGPGSYGRVKRLSDDSYVMVYSTGGSNIGGKNFIRFQSEAYGEWTDAQIQKDNDNTFTNKNAELIELPDGRLMYAWLHRINYDINDVGVSKIMCAFSNDKGKTWEDEQCIYEGTATYGLGVWEPCMLLLPTGELQVYWANEAAAGAPSQNISMRRSWNMGRTWIPGTVTVCYRPGSRDGMPVPCYLQNEKGIIVAIEDPGFMGTFKPMLVHTSVEDNWSSPYVDANSPDRWSIFQSDPKLSSEVYSGQPYVIQLNTGETVYSAVCADGRNPNTNDTHAPMAVWVGNSDGKDFIARSYPFPFANEPNARCIWPSIMQYNDSTMMAVGTVEGECKHSGIWTSEGIIMRPIKSVEVAEAPDWSQIVEHLFIGAESAAEARIRSTFNSDNLYLHFDVSDKYRDANDGVEIFIAPTKPSGTRQTGHYRFRVNADGTVKSYTGTSTSWKSAETDIMGTSEDNGEGYTVDVAIPWSVIGGQPVAEDLYMHYQLHNTDTVDGKTETVAEHLSGGTDKKPATWMRMPLDRTTDVRTIGTTVTGNGNCYNIQGQKVSEGYRGIVIKNGKKVIL